MIKAIMFDFANTLVQTAKARKEIKPARLGFKIFKKYGISIDYDTYLKAWEMAREFYAKNMDGNPKRYKTGFFSCLVLKFLNKKVPMKKCKKMDLDYFEVLLKKVKIMPGTIKVLDFLKKNQYKIFLISNGNKAKGFRMLHKFDVAKYFDEIIFSEEFGKEKSSLDSFNHILNKHNLKPKECVMVGDRLDEDIYAKKIGIKTVYFNTVNWNNYYKETEKPDYVIKSLKDLIKILEKENLQ